MIEQPKVQTIEAYKTIFGSNPQVAIASLRDRVNFSAGESLFRSPAVVGIERDGAVCIRTARTIHEAHPHEAREQAMVSDLAACLAHHGAIYLVSVREPIQEKPMTSNSDNGIVTIPSHQSVDDTVKKLEAILHAKGVKLFAVIDHSGEAEKSGMQMRNTKLLIFGNPKAGTPLMIATPSIAIDLPLKILVWEGADGKARVSYNAPAYLQARHGLPAELLQNIAVIEGLANKAAE